MFEWVKNLFKNHAGKFALGGGAVTVGLAAILIFCPPAGAVLWTSIAVGTGIAGLGTAMATGAWLALEDVHDNNTVDNEKVNQELEQLKAMVVPMRNDVVTLSTQLNTLILAQQRTEQEIAELRGALKNLTEQFGRSNSDIIEAQKTISASLNELSIKLTSQRTQASNVAQTLFSLPKNPGPRPGPGSGPDLGPQGPAAIH